MDPKSMSAFAAAAPVYDAEEFKIVARYRKAKALTATLLAHGVETADAVDSLVIRELATKIAEVRPSSDVTWALVKEMLREAL